MKSALQIQCNCKRHDIMIMDYEIYTEMNNRKIIINRHCNTCGSHWNGPEDNPSRYTQKEWDRYLES